MYHTCDDLIICVFERLALLDDVDFGALHLVSRQIARVGSEFLFYEVCFFALCKSVSRLLSISKDDFVRSKVKSLLYEEVDMSKKAKRHERTQELDSYIAFCNGFQSDKHDVRVDT